jgi:biotin carboxylase
MDGLFLVLEPGNHMFKVIEAAGRRGLTVVVCHSQPVSPPAPLDEALPWISQYLAIESWSDSDAAFETIRAFCGQQRVRGTYAGYEITLRMNARLRQHFGLPGPTPEKLDFLLDKAAVRDTLRKASLSSLRVVAPAEVRALTEWPFPGRAAFLKPVNGSGSIYVRRCTSLADVRELVAEWDGKARHLKRFVADYLHSGPGLCLEEEAVGELLSVEGYSHRGRYVPVGITDRTVLARDVSVEMGTSFPYPHPRSDEILERARAIHACLEIDHGTTHAEMIVPPSGDIELVELNVRMGGGDILIVIDHALGIRFEDDLVTLAVGEGPFNELPSRPVRYVSGQDFLAPAHVRRFDSMEIPGDDVFFRKIMVKPGTELASTDFQTDQVAACAVAADTYLGALALGDAVRAQTRINGELLGDDPNNVVIHYGQRLAGTERSAGPR